MRRDLSLSLSVCKSALVWSGHLCTCHLIENEAQDKPHDLASVSSPYSTTNGPLDSAAVDAQRHSSGVSIPVRAACGAPFTQQPCPISATVDAISLSAARSSEDLVKPRTPTTWIPNGRPIYALWGLLLSLILAAGAPQ